MQQLTIGFLMNSLLSTRVKNAVASAAFFGAAGALRGACARLESFTRTIHNIQDKYPERAEKMRTSPVFKDLDRKAEEAASRAAAIHAIAEEHGVMIRMEFEPPMPKAKTQEEVKRIAEITRMDAATIGKHIEQANDKRYAQELEAADLAASLFWSATAAHDAPVKFDSVAKAIERTRLQLLTWSSIDFAELALIAEDEEQLNDWMSNMSDDPQQFSENTMDEDEQAELHRIAEIKALDAHAARAQTIAYLDNERDKAKKASTRRRIKRDQAA